MTRFVKRSHPACAWLSGLPSSTDRAVLSSSTPRSAQADRQPCAGADMPRAAANRLWMFRSDGGIATPGGKEEADYGSPVR